MSVVQLVVQDLWQSHMQFWSQFGFAVCHFVSLSARNPAVAGEFAVLLLLLRVAAWRMGRGKCVCGGGGGKVRGRGQGHEGTGGGPPAGGAEPTPGAP